MKLNLGSGRDIKEGWTNVDFIKAEGIDVVWNLDKFPYPFKDNSVDEILLNHILEHLWYPEKVIEELWRITKYKGKITIRVPHFSCWAVWGDIIHKRTFTHTSLFSFSSVKKRRASKSLINNKKEIFIMENLIGFDKIKK